MDFDAYASIHPDYFASRFSALPVTTGPNLFRWMVCRSAERFPFYNQGAASYLYE